MQRDRQSARRAGYAPGVQGNGRFLLPRLAGEKSGGDEIGQPVGKQVELFRTIEARVDDALRPRLENEGRNDGRGKGEEEEHGGQREARIGATKLFSKEVLYSRECSALSIEGRKQSDHSHVLNMS